MLSGVADRTQRARHRRKRSRGGGRHRAGFPIGRWMIPAGLAVAILVFVTAVLLVTDVVTSAILPALEIRR
jgi:hypothetical protein